MDKENRNGNLNNEQQNTNNEEDAGSITETSDNEYRQLNKQDNELIKQHKKNKNKNSKKNKSETDFIIVGIGASAGGLESLEKFFKNMPPENGMAFVIVQHLSPDYKSLMVELLSKHTKMPVVRIEDSIRVEPNTVYLIPPKKTLIIFHGKLLLSDMDYKHGLNLPINTFFRSLAEDQGKKCVGVILSGTGSDGTLGVREIKGSGGMVMVQDEQTAKFDGMPKSAISTGLIDYILAPEEMPEILIKYTKHPYIAEDKKEDFIKDEDDLTKILALIRNKKNVDFTYYKDNTIIRRIKRRVSLNQIDSIKDYIRFLQENPYEINTLYGELLIGVTNFFRDPKAFETLKQKVIPRIFENKKPSEPVRVWIVACSTGEEAYSIAILIKEHLDLIKVHYDVKIFASDIDETAIKTASKGLYPESIVTDISPNRIKRFFVKKGNSYQITKDIRSMILFTTHNVIKDAPFSNVDLITCRNLLIYLEPIMQKKILSLFHFSLISNGFMMLGPSESIGDLIDSFSLYDSKWKVYQRRGLYRSSLSTNMFNIPKKKPPYYRANQIKEHSNTRELAKNDDIRKYEIIYKTFLEEYLPPTIVINEDYELLHIFGDANKYLKFPTGRVNYNIKNIIIEDLSIALSTAIHKAIKDKKKIKYKNISIERPLHDSDEDEDDDDNTNNNAKKKNKIREDINLIVKAIYNHIFDKTLLMISFEKNIEEKDDIKSEKDLPQEYVENFEINDKVKQHIKDLEQELKYTQESLQATIEELETSNEELQSTNEELLASNEELQSTNEELQSVNEELYTVNAEYQIKIQELTELNNDINYLLATIEIGIVFLDLNFCVRKYTPVALKLINLLKVDIGRPISHLHHKMIDVDLMEDINFTMDKRVPIEKEIKTTSGEWYIMKVHPHYSADTSMQGVNLIFIDITELKRMYSQIEDKNAENERLLEKLKISDLLIKNFPNGSIIQYDKDLRYNMVRGKGLEEANLHSGDLEGKTIYEVFSDEICKILEPNMKKALEGEERKFEIAYKSKVYMVHCLPVKDNDNKEPKGMIMTQNITERNKMIIEIKNTSKNLRKFSYAIENIPSVVVITNPGGRIEYVNSKFTQLTGYVIDEVVGKNPRILKSGLRKTEFYKELWGKIRNGEKWIGNFPNKKKNGEIYWEHAKIAPIKDKNGEIIHIVKVSEEITAKVIAKEEMIEHNKRIEQLIDEDLDNMTKEEIREFMQNELSTHAKIANMLDW